MRFDYGTQISPFPIPLSVGMLRKPKLRDIADPKSKPAMSFTKFMFYEFLISMTPKEFFTKAEVEKGQEFWDSLSEEEKRGLTVYDLIQLNPTLMQNFLEVFNFFFEETVLFVEGVFVLVNPDKDYSIDTPQREDIVGVIDSHNFSEILYAIQQVCCIAQEEEEETPKFKNKIAEQMYYRMKEAEKEQKKKTDKDMTLPNIISKVSAKHNSLNFTNIWDLTIFQLLDNFASMREGAMYEIEWTRVAVWGDEKRTFDPARWYKNDFDKH